MRNNRVGFASQADMSLTQTAATYEPSVRGDAMLLTHGRKGTAADLLLAAGAVVLDGALGGHIDVVGRRLLGFERRRVVAGPELPEAPPLMAELRARVQAAPPDEPWGWFDRAAGFALEGVTEELEAAGVTTPLRLNLRTNAMGEFVVRDVKVKGEPEKGGKVDK